MGLFSRKKTEDKKEVKKEKESTDKKAVAKKAVKTVVAKKEDKKTTTIAKPVNKKRTAYRVLLKPLVTEKAANMSSLGKYVFEVSVDANKIEVAKAVEEVYGKKPVSVNIMNFGGKKVTRGRYAGKRKDWRKAIVTLGKNETINIYEGI